MEPTEKIREDRVRRMLDRQGYKLVKSRRRDPRAWDYGTYMLIDKKTGEVEETPLVHGYVLDGNCLTLGQAEGWARREHEAEDVFGNSLEDWVEVGRVGNDTGRLLIADPAYVGAGTLPESFLSGHEGGHEGGLGYITTSGIGDGNYPVRVLREEDGTVAAIRVDFLPHPVLGMG